MDHIHDKNLSGFAKIMQNIEIPEFLKQAELNDPEDLKDLPKEAFANPETREFPIDTQENTWLSMAYFYKFAAREPNRLLIEKLLEKAAQFWDMPESEIKKLKSLQDKIIEKTASAVYTLKLTHEDEVLYKTDITTEDDLQKAASEIVQNPGKYTYALRKQAAEQLLGIAEKMNVQLPVRAELEKTAARGVNTLGNVQSLIVQRACMYRDILPELSVKLEKIASELESDNGYIQTKQLQKVAGLLDAGDRAVGFNVKYTNPGFPPPEQLLVKYTVGMLKEASESCVLLKNGCWIGKQTIRDNSKELRNLFENVFCLSPEKPEDFVKMAAELTEKEADIFERHLSTL